MSKKKIGVIFSLCDKQFQVFGPSRLKLSQALTRTLATLICFSPLPFLVHSFFVFTSQAWLLYLQPSCLHSRKSKHRRGKAKADGQKDSPMEAFPFYSRRALSLKDFCPHLTGQNLKVSGRPKSKGGRLSHTLAYTAFSAEAGRKGGNWKWGQTCSDTFRTKGVLGPHTLMLTLILSRRNLLLRRGIYFCRV